MPLINNCALIGTLGHNSNNYLPLALEPISHISNIE